uniref:Nicotianamine synthase n=1 Tax=Nelumbo nucifera TaxID=4432 RepID=A0A822YHA3_NELNU|nr:TPA_asm: hypothetical protein HUJ06_030316 [Nelumbo nucifera]
MFFHTSTDVLNVFNSLRNYDVVFLEALVGMGKVGKTRIINHPSQAKPSLM